MNSLFLPKPSSRRFSLIRASEVFSKHLLQSRYVQHRVGQKTLQFGILVFKRLQALGIGRLQAATLRAPLVKRRITDAVLSAQLNGRHPNLMLLEYSDDLFFAEAGSFHVLSPPPESRLNKLKSQGSRSSLLLSYIEKIYNVGHQTYTSIDVANLEPSLQFFVVPLRSLGCNARCQTPTKLMLRPLYDQQ